MNSAIPGEYLLHNIREMASGFLLKEDQTFQFFFTYGALDRFATGNWALTGRDISFNTRKWSGADFTLVKTEPLAGDEGIVVQLENPNPMLAAYLQLSLSEGSDDSWIQFRQHGHLHLPPQPFDSLSLRFEFCPERFTRLPVTPGNQAFTIRPEQSLFELYFENFMLRFSGANLKGGHPMMPGEFEYFKSAARD